VLLAAVLLAACNIDTLTQDFLDKYARETDTGTGTSSGGSGSGSSGGGSSDGPAESSGLVPGGDSGTETTASAGSAAGSTGDETSGAGETTGAPAVCGNAIVEGEEECDDPGDTRCFKCFRDRLVFVTSEAVQGDFAFKSLENLDYWCNHLAAVAGLLTNNQFRFKTWVSTSEESAAERIFHSRGRYVLMNGLVFAESWDALMAGQILNPLNVDENSQKGKYGAFTDTKPDGSAMPGTHCKDWQSDAFADVAYFGSNTAVDGSWTLYVGEATNPLPCDAELTLYCFESP